MGTSGKGGEETPAPPPIQDPMQDQNMMQDYQRWQNMQMVGQQMLSTQMSKPQAPPESTVDRVNWEDRRKTLQENISKDMADDAKSRRGRASTIGGSALTGDEVETVETVLSGE